MKVGESPLIEASHPPGRGAFPLVGAMVMLHGQFEFGAQRHLRPLSKHTLEPPDD